jgi:hypothetical protein
VCAAKCFGLGDIFFGFVLVASIAVCNGSKIDIDFKSDFDIAAIALSQQYGSPVKSGTDDDHAIPLTGIMHFRIWRTDDAGLFLAISHEDRGTPILIMLGGTSDQSG